MSKIREKNISNLFAASLSFVGEEKVANLSLDKEDVVIEKYAGIDIYQPTVDNVEQFVRKYMMNELAFFPKALKIHTFLNPSQFDTANPDYVAEATGVAKVKLHDANLEFPFYITDGELVPFDIIQLNGQRVPYSRENLRRVLFGIDKTFVDKINGANGTAAGEFTPYVKVEKSVNPATSSGFLGNVLQIQDQTLRNNGTNFIVASEKLDEGIEKLSSMKMLTAKEIEILETQFTKQAHDEFKGELEKFAKEIEDYNDKDDLKLFKNLSNVQFENANSLPNGTCISFPEKKNREMFMTKGIVIDNYMSIAGKKPKTNKVVVAEDGRIVVLESGDKFLCFKSDQKFTLPMKSVIGLKEGDIFLAFNGNQALAPSVVEYVTERGLNESKVQGDVKFKIFSVSTVDTISTLLSLMDDASPLGTPHGMPFGSNKSMLTNYKLAPMPGVKFNELKYGEYLKKLSEKTGISELLLAPILREYNVANDGAQSRTVLCTDYDDTKIIEVKGVISDYLKDKSDLRNLVETEGEFEMKTAAQGETIYIKCIDPSRNVFYVQIKYIDKSKTVFNQMTKEYRDVPEAGVKQILRVLAFDGGQSTELIQRAKEMGSVLMPLPGMARVDMLTGANVTNRSTEKVKNVMGKLINPQAVGDAVLTSALGALMTGAIASRGLVGQPGVKDKAREALALASKFASESEALSVAFEKSAMEHKSPSMLKVAKVMAGSALLGNKVIEALNGNIYPRLAEAAYNIATSKDELERIASELVELKVVQYKNKDHIINPNYIQGAVRQLDNMYKMAYELVQQDETFREKLAATMSEIPGTPAWEKDEEKKEKNSGKKDQAEEKSEKKAESVAEELGIVKDHKECPKCHNNPCTCKGGNPLKNEQAEKKAEVDNNVINDVTEGLGAKQFADRLKAQGKNPKVNYSKEKGWTVTAEVEQGNETETNEHTKKADDNDTAVGLEPNNVETMVLEEEIKQKQEQDATADLENEALKDSVDSDTHYVMASENKSGLEKEAGIGNVLGEVANGWKAVGKGIGEATKDGAKFGETMKNTWNGMSKAQKVGVAGTTGAGLVAANNLNNGMTKEQKDGLAIAGAAAPMMALASEELNRLVMEKEANIADTLKTVGKVGGATYGALGGAALGGVAGALGAQDGHRAEGALKGGLVGGVTGGVGGALGGKVLAEKGQQVYKSGLKHGFAGGAAVGAGLGAAATHVAENGGKEAVKEMASKAKDVAGNVVNKVKETADNVATKAKETINNVKAQGQTAEQTGAQQWEQAQKDLQSQPMPQQEVMQQPQQAVQQPTHNNGYLSQEELDSLLNGQGLQGKPPVQQVPVQQPVVQGQPQVVQGGQPINPSRPPAPRPEPAPTASTTPGNAVAVDGNGQPVQQQPAKGPGWFSGVANWWNNLGNIPTSQAQQEVKGLNYAGLNPSEQVFHDAPQQINSTASELLDALFMEKMAAMNIPTEKEKENESNGENLADITCEVCGYKGQPDEYGKCPVCGAQGGVKPVDPASKVEQPDDHYDMDRHMIDQDQIAQGETEIMDYV